ncbi:MAG: CTP synthase, partial [Candidatus Omnitrophica bacterium]|nr:CTP synthase [Candidatus Omnitrophota bacterium]
EYARTHNIPFLGLCLGMQVAVIEFARNVCGLKKANSSEFNKKTPHAVIDIISEQKRIKSKGGTMRLGAYRCRIKKSTRSFSAYRSQAVHERHRHRYEFNNKYRRIMQKNGMVFAGLYIAKNLVEIIELKEHPWFVACQFHPEFKSKPDKAHPLFRDFIKASLSRRLYSRTA